MDTGRHVTDIFLVRVRQPERGSVVFQRVLAINNGQLLDGAGPQTARPGLE